MRTAKIETKSGDILEVDFDSMVIHIDDHVTLNRNTVFGYNVVAVIPKGRLFIVIDKDTDKNKNKNKEHEK